MKDDRNEAFVLAVTGGIACGKSETGRILEKLGFEVLDADETAHRLMQCGTDVHHAVVERFGKGILDGSGEIDRKKLGKIVFQDRKALEDLNRLVHPAVEEVLRNWINDLRKKGRRGAALVPLLFESGMDRLDWDAILCVSADRETVMRRLAERGLSREEAERRIAAQWPLEEKERRADVVIRNEGSLQELESALRGLVNRTAAG